MPLSKDTYLASVRADADALAAAAARGLDRRVPSCPEWTMKDLATHVGGVLRFWSWVAAEKLIGPPEQMPELARPDSSVLVDWIRESGDVAIDIFTPLSVDEPAWNWSTSPDTAGWIMRRMAQELAIHRWDGENAHEIAQPIGPDIATDGIDEMFDVFVVTKLSNASETSLPPMRVVAAERAWTVAVNNGTLQTGDASPTVTISGDASNVLLYLWGRVGSEALDVDGDTEDLAAWRQFVTI